jgi:hypothetical protein
VSGGCSVVAEPDSRSDNPLTLTDCEAGLTWAGSRGIRTENTGNSTTDDLSIRRFGKRLCADSSSTDIAAEDRESHPAYAGNFNLSDIDNRF